MAAPDGIVSGIFEQLNLAFLRTVNGSGPKGPLSW